MLQGLLFALVALTTSLKLPPPAIGRRAAVCLLPACLFAPQIAEAKYRASLAEMKGYGSSPYVDQMKGTRWVRVHPLGLRPKLTAGVRVHL